MTDIARSFLFVPATQARRIGKALESQSDAVIIDLEDSVALAEKSSARAQLSVWLRAQAVSPRRPVWVRVNAASTPFCLADLVACAEPGVSGIVLPKLQSVDEARTVDWALTQLEAQNGLTSGAITLMGIIESSAGLAQVDTIATATRRLKRLMFGAIDLAAEMGLEAGDDGPAFDMARFAIARASYAAGLAPPVDSVHPDFSQPEPVRASALRARSLGFGGKACIHPAQLDAVHAAFAPTAEELAWAHRVVAAFEAAEQSGQAAVALDGEMIDIPVAARARRLIRQGPPA